MVWLDSAISEKEKVISTFYLSNYYTNYSLIYYILMSTNSSKKHLNNNTLYTLQYANIL